MPHPRPGFVEIGLQQLDEPPGSTPSKSRRGLTGEPGFPRDRQLGCGVIRMYGFGAL
jgi:hypothetical protein